MGANDQSGQRPRRGPWLERTARTARGAGFYTTIPIMLLVGPVLGFVFGSWLERRFGHAPWLSFGGVVVGGVASVRQIVRVMRRASELQSTPEDETKDS